MNILLIYPVPPRQHWPSGAMRSTWVPSGLASIGRTLLRDGHQVRIHMREEQLVKLQFDWDAAWARLRDELTAFQPDLVGISVLTPSVCEMREIALLTRLTCKPGTLVVAGGVHPTALPEETLRNCPELDIIAIGEGESAMAGLAAGTPRAEIPGIVYRDGDHLCATGRPLVEQHLDRLGLPAYELFDMSYYTERKPWMIRWLSLRGINLRTSRGCTNACRFCAGYRVSGVGVRYHSVDYVIDNIWKVVRDYGIEAVHFEDDTIGGDPHRLQSLCAALRREGLDRLKWDCCLRVDQAEPELLAEMKAAGCIQIEYGIESGSDAALKRLNKNSSVSANYRAIRETQKAGMRAFADIMFGLPEETPSEFRATANFIRKARPDIISASCLCPLPGTPLFNELPAEKRAKLDYGELAYMEEPGLKLNITAMSDRTLRRNYTHVKRHLLRPRMLWEFLRDLPEEERELKASMSRLYRRFCRRHPISALRLPRGPR